MVAASTAASSTWARSMGHPRRYRVPVGTHYGRGLRPPPPARGKTAIASARPDVVGTRDGTRSLASGFPSVELVFVNVSDFAGKDEDGADPLLGDEVNVLIGEDADVMIYGDGGVGKTSLAIDMAAHLAAGDLWIGIPVHRRVRVGLVENEGPRPLFRKKLRQKLAAWTGQKIDDGYLLQLEEPWGKVSLERPEVREALAAQIAALELDVVVIGPISRSGMNEAGTLQQVRDFVDLFADVRAKAGRRVTFVLIHHENRGGQVSGAWEGAVDTLFHVQSQGFGQTRLFVQKARWGGMYHKRKLQLAWTSGEGFEVRESEERDDNAVMDEILTFVLARGGTGWNKVDEAVAGQGERLRRLRDNLLAGGRLVNHGTESRMKLWHADDPALPPNDPDQTTLAEAT